MYIDRRTLAASSPSLTVTHCHSLSSPVIRGRQHTEPAPRSLTVTHSHSQSLAPHPPTVGQSTHSLTHCHPPSSVREIRHVLLFSLSSTEVLRHCTESSHSTSRTHPHSQHSQRSRPHSLLRQSDSVLSTYNVSAYALLPQLHIMRQYCTGRSLWSDCVQGVCHMQSESVVGAPEPTDSDSDNGNDNATTTTTTVQRQQCNDNSAMTTGQRQQGSRFVVAVLLYHCCRCSVVVAARHTATGATVNIKFTTNFDTFPGGA